MRIFINHVNTYSGVALARTLRHMDNVLNRLFGTARGLEEGTGIATEDEQNERGVPVPSCIRRLISKRNPQQLLQNLLTCSLAVFDLHNTHPDEVELIIKKLKTAQIQHPLTVVLISSLLTWGNTRRQYEPDPPEDVEAGDTVADGADEKSPTDTQNNNAPQEEAESPSDTEELGTSAFRSVRSSGSSANKRAVLKPRIFSGTNFELRVPPKNYERWKMVETLLMSLNSKENFRGIVISAGLMYGYGEEALYEPFKAAWLGLRTHKLIGAYRESTGNSDDARRDVKLVGKWENKLQKGRLFPR